MSKNKEKIQKAEGTIVAVESALSKSEQFIEKNKNILFYVIIGIVLIILAYFGYQKFIQTPKERDAQAAMFVAEHYFDVDSLNLALNGDQANPGFLGIIDEYGSTKSGNLARYYAGICYLKLGQFQEAIDNLKEFDSDDDIIQPMAYGAMGDAYLELNDNTNALTYYTKAAEVKDNDFTTPMFLMKAAWVYEMNGDYVKALECYNKVKKEHNRSFEARDVDKYIARAQGLSGQK
jgi:tetratricopeptide (TPR) repeat protein